MSSKSWGRFLVVFKTPHFKAWKQYTSEVQSVEFAQNSYLVMKIVLNATIIAVILFLAILSASFISGNDHVGVRIAIALVVLLYLWVIRLLTKNRKLLLSGWLLIILYTSASTLLFAGWGLNTPVGILTFGFIILLAGIILGARYILPVTAIVILLLTSIHIASKTGFITPQLADLSKPSDYTDVLGYAVIFSIFALVSWISGRKMEQTLRKALMAEAALQEEKDLLAVRLEEQTQRLKVAQLEEMQQLYRFAELGQLSTIVMHELANHLTVLTLDIDDLEQRHHRSEAITHAKESIGYLDKMVTQVRHQLQETNESTTFTILPVLSETIASLQQKATHAGVSIEIKLPPRAKSLVIKGDPLRLSQIITIILTNAIEAYTADTSEQKTVSLEVASKKAMLSISITDVGVGLSKSARKDPFKPFQSSKKTGMGIGLFVVKQMMETHFKGSISLDPRTDQTTFTLHLPKHTTKRAD